MKTKTKCFEVTGIQMIKGADSDVDLKNPVICQHWKCDWLFYSQINTRVSYYSILAFHHHISFSNFSLDFHSPLFLHPFYSLSCRSPAEISSFYSWTKFFPEWTYFDAILPEAANSRNELLITFWTLSLCHKNA